MEKFFNVRGLDIYVKMLGAGTPLVFLHGGPGGEHRYFLPHLEELANTFQLIFYDQRGCGQSQEPEDKDTYTMDEEVETLEALRAELGIEKLNLVGESWGSMLGLLYAAKYPKKADKLFLTAAVGATKDGYLGFGKELENRLTLEDKHLLDMMVEKLNNKEIDVQEIFSIIDPYYVYSRENLSKKTATKSNEAVNAILGNDIGLNYDLTDRLERLKEIPIMVAQGEHDINTPAMLQDLLLQYIPHAQLEVISECGHWTVIEQPDIMMQKIRNFFGRCSQ
ncbi:proline iminopeptidase [Bacillus sp. M6-12]|uniref:alpha/beta fold hydrolase n=1 Tax=Bacillus sp. M6-12 TaxID=2054166 RepID=UPI000C75CFAE|nr:alpha/beta hydrolase [Bacillus sp. M6-12]PLS17489.1 proline iminopeptidase [Bacillus sp. M6-12]